MHYEKLDDYPEGFLWGASSAAYQIEGAAAEDGKGPSIWDVYAHEPGNTYKGTTGDVAVDHYHRLVEDLDLMKRMGLKAYRFSVAWSRVIPTGDGEVNPAGLDFYARLIDGLLERGIQPVPTLYHWDLPEALQEKYEGWESRECIDAFEKYCRVMFTAFGDRVKYWITINEQNVFTSMGYRWQLHPPKKNDVKTMFLVNHHVNLANARAINLFHKLVPGGLIGPSFGYGPVYPLDSDPANVLASVNADDFNNNWWLDVYCRGEYPYFTLKALQRMGIAPEVSAADDALLRSATPDFLGVNYYHGGTVAENRLDRPVDPAGGKPSETDKEDKTDETARADAKGEKAEKKEFSGIDPYLMQPKEGQAQTPEVPMFQSMANPYVEKSAWGWEIDPVGFRIALRQLFEKYRLPLFVTENGLGAADTVQNGEIHDSYRIKYLEDHLLAMKEAVTDGVPVIGYCAWSFTDLLSWLNGYRKRYGFVYVDCNDEQSGTLDRTPKDSFFWYRDIIKTNGGLLGKE